VSETGVGASAGGAGEPSGEKLRLFVACELPDAQRQALAAWGKAAAAGDRALRVLPEASLHVTMHFIGWQPPEQADPLAAAVREGGEGVVAPIALRLGEALWLAPRRPHVLTCAIADESGALAELQARIAEPLAQAADGWRPEQRAFRPHITVARVRRGARPLPGAEPEPPGGAFSAAALTLMRSHLSPAGARYEALERVLLPQPQHR
jgi:2'-5' RNA ligase